MLFQLWHCCSCSSTRCGDWQASTWSRSTTTPSSPPSASRVKRSRSPPGHHPLVTTTTTSLAVLVLKCPQLKQHPHPVVPKQCCTLIINTTLTALCFFFFRSRKKFSTAYPIVSFFFSRPFHGNFKFIKNCPYDFHKILQSFYTQRGPCVGKDIKIVWLECEKHSQN